jgi:hypothetical protein
VIDWIIDNWQNIVIPVIAFLATCVVGWWIKKLLDRLFERWKTKWQGSQLIKTSVSPLVFFWFLILGIAIGMQVSVLSEDIQTITARVVGSIFFLSLGWVVAIIGEKLAKMYLPKMKVSRPTIILVINAIRIIIIFAVVLTILEIWGITTTFALLIIAVAVLVVALALRSTVPNVLAGAQLSATQHIKVGDFIKLETGEEGYVLAVSWNNTQIKALDDSLIVIPNNKLLQHKVVNYGKVLNKAKTPFRFYSRTHLTELTGLRAKNLREFANMMKKASDAVIYFHTHHFLEEHSYMAREPSNDFAVWITDALGEEVLGEKIASINTFEFSDMKALRERFVGIIEEHLAKGYDSREAMTGREFYFMKSVTIVIPTPYLAHDLREFVETLRQISIGSLYYHVFESRLKLGNGRNDFSVWLRDSLGEEELAERVARFDPFMYTLEGLRLALIQSIEKHIR